MGGKGRIGSHRTEHNRSGQDSIGDWIQVLKMRVGQGEVLYIGQTIAIADCNTEILSYWISKGKKRTNYQLWCCPVRILSISSWNLELRLISYLGDSYKDRSRLTDQSTDWPIDWLSHWRTGWLTRFLAQLLTHSLTLSVLLFIFYLHFLIRLCRTLDSKIP